MTVYRLAREKYAADLSGAGASRVGGRCNPPGVAAVYAGQNVALAVLEVLVHLDKTDVPEDYVLIAIEIGTNVPIWPADATQARLESAHRSRPVITVPSVIVPHERNYVLYPEAPGLALAIAWTEAFRFDSRLFPIPIVH